ncbi:hypothetical protein DO021_18100 [Desulfobacter hydrogenophilus]|uniref:Uncharacterized protein n=1 Tax=Desulfobacter hydrogenophilus TaxID=2291 RepID=A0A328FBZ2_9BACT|nr:hypothetical protein DO021_18100 [Desulfobacter hydrogenophilus]
MPILKIETSRVQQVKFVRHRTRTARSAYFVQQPHKSALFIPLSVTLADLDTAGYKGNHMAFFLVL